jgi:hypothetical protein
MAHYSYLCWAALFVALCRNTEKILCCYFSFEFAPVFDVFFKVAVGETVSFLISGRRRVMRKYSRLGCVIPIFNLLLFSFRIREPILM